MFSKLMFVMGVMLPAALCGPSVAGAVKAAAPGVLADVAAWAKPLSDTEMGEMRGGFAGFAFNVIMTGTIDNLDNSTGITNAPPPNVTTSNGMVNVQTAIGSFNGASGVFQIANLDNSSF